MSQHYGFEMRPCDKSEGDMFATSEQANASEFQGTQRISRIDIFEDLASRIVDDPRDARALFQLGNAYAMHGRYDSAIHSYQQAIGIQPDYVEALVNIATCYMKQSKLGLAIETLQAAVKTKPELWWGYYSLGNAYLGVGEQQKAIAALEKAVSLKPRLVPALWKLAVIYHRRDELGRAIEFYVRVIEANGGSIDAHFNLANAQAKLGDTQAAICSYRNVLDIYPDHKDACRNLAIVLEQTGELEEAIRLLEHAFALEPSSSDLCLRIATLLRRGKRHKSAVGYLKKCLDSQPGHTEAQDELAEACSKSEVLDEAIRVKPELLSALCLLGATYIELGEVDSGVRYFRRASFLQPTDQIIRCNLGLALLLRGDYSEGWSEYEARLLAGDDDSSKQAVVRAQIEPYSQQDRCRHLLLLREQGLGDEVMFYSMLNDARRLADRITVSADQRLLPLLRRSFRDITFISASGEVTMVDYDRQLRIGSLGQYVRNNEEDFLSVQEHYLVADCAKTSAIRGCLRVASNRTKKLVCGLSWKSANPEIGSEKSVQLEDLSNILSIPDIMFVSLQYGDVRSEIAKYALESGVQVEMVNEIDNLNDLDGLAALINACDMVITISNTTAHLAGALGIPTCILVRKRADWRWGVNGYSTPWYRSVRIFRQSIESDWEVPVNELKEELQCISQLAI